MKNSITILLLSILLPLAAVGQKSVLSGIVLSNDEGEPLAGASVLLKGTTRGVITDAEGHFEIAATAPVTLVISFIGYGSQEVHVESYSPVSIMLEQEASLLGEIAIVSTGYQNIPDERVTGSFNHLDNEDINRSVSPDVLSRIEGLTPGVQFNTLGEEQEITIRGVSSLYANKDPLIILDNFPYDGALNTINPNDVQSISILKDAAAASIWGARAGNGVIVITTKSGGKGQPPKLTVSSNVTFSQQPDAHDMPRMSPKDFLEVERLNFEAGYYNSDINSSSHPAISPAVELLALHRDNMLSDSELEKELTQLTGHDVRDDFNKYLYRHPVNQQYALSLQGGGDLQKYYLSLGYDKNIGQLVGDALNRVTVSLKNTWSFFNDRFTVDGSIYHVKYKTTSNGIYPWDIRMSSSRNLPFYSQLADNEGNAISVTKDYSTTFKRSLEAAGFIDWHYRPLEEIELRDNDKINNDTRLMTGLNYKVLPGLILSARYQYWTSQSEARDHYKPDSYYARNYINRYTQVDASGRLTYPVSKGGILDLQSESSDSHTLRGQLDFNHKWEDRHLVYFVGGFEVKDFHFLNENQRFYGYNKSTASSIPVDYITSFSQSYNASSRYSIPNVDSHKDKTDRFVSYYGNMSYSYDQRYVLTLSARKDESNLFGVEANQRGVPLWSAGLAWNVNKEHNYHWGYLPYLKLRATYGYNGNIDKSVTAFTTARYSGNSSNTSLTYASILNPPNSQLQWERIKMFNAGLDFVTSKGRISGSFEYYTKSGEDLIGYAPISATTGQQTFRGNVASTKGSGFDMEISSINLDGGLRWESSFIFSHNKMEVEQYKDEPAVFEILNFADRGSFPLEGYPLYSIYSYPWGGLNGDTGDPQGYLNGEISDDIGAIIDQATPDSLIFHGSSRPTSFGTLRNTLVFGNLSLSFIINYRLGYYVRRSSIYYGSDRGLGGHSDFSLRWQQPGDEQFTDVPSIPASGNSDRDNFYTYSSALVERGDNIRLQDINLSYTVKGNKKLPFEHIKLFFYMKNIALLWKASDHLSDPDHQVYPLLRSCSLGLQAIFK